METMVMLYKAWADPHWFPDVSFSCGKCTCPIRRCLKSVTTMSNSGPYLVTPVTLQLYSSTPVAHHLLRSRSHRYTSAMYDPWSNPYTVLTTPRCLPWLDVSSPCARYISYLVSFSPDLVYFTWTWLYFTRTWPSTFSGYPLSAF